MVTDDKGNRGTRKPEAKINIKNENENETKTHQTKL